MKVFKINDEVFFNLGWEIFKGTIDRNNWVKLWTYTVLYEVKNWEFYKNIYKSENLFKTKKEVEEKIILWLENELEWKKDHYKRKKKELEEESIKIEKLIDKIEELSLN